MCAFAVLISVCVAVIVMSSAYVMICVCFGRVGMSEVYNMYPVSITRHSMLKSVGERTPPCGTPVLNWRCVDVLFLNVV